MSPIRAEQRALGQMSDGDFLRHLKTLTNGCSHDRLAVAAEAFDPKNEGRGGWFQVCLECGEKLWVVISREGPSERSQVTHEARGADHILVRITADD